MAVKFYIKLIDRLPEYYERRFGKVEPKASGNVLLQTGGILSDNAGIDSYDVRQADSYS